MYYTTQVSGFVWSNTYRPSGIYFLAPRIDGHAGDGSPQNPLDASTAAKFDAIITNIQPNTTYFLYPGVYPTHGCKWGVRGLQAGTYILGSGPEVTTIQLATTWDSSQANYVGGTSVGVLGTLYDGNVFSSQANIRIADLTIDCNAQNIPQATGHTLNATYLYADNIKIQNVTIKNTADKKGNNSEAFPIGAVGSDTLIDRVRISNHIRSNTPVSVNNGHTIILISSGYIVNCHIDLSNSTGYGYSHAFHPISEGGISECIVYGIPEGYTEMCYADTPGSTPLTNSYIADSRGYNLRGGVQTSPTQSIRSKVINNYFQLSTGSNAGYGGIISWFNPSSHQDYHIINNYIDHISSGFDNSYGIRFLDDFSNRIVLLNNIFKTGLLISIQSSGGGLYAIGNQYTDGTIPTNSHNNRNLGFDLSGVTVPHP